MLIVIVGCQTLPQAHFRSIKATQSKNDVTNQFSDREFVLAVATCFIRECDCFEVIRDFGSLNRGGNPFPVDGSIAEQKLGHHSIPGWRSGYSLRRNFPSIWFHSNVIQEFNVCSMVKKFSSIFEGKYDPNNFLCKSRHPKRHYLEKICVD
jgi:hypothetical protein